jgi:lysozyme family protein
MNYEDYRPDVVAAQFKACTLEKTRLPWIMYRTKAIILSRHRYEAVERVTGTPWWAIGCIHQLESGGRFDCHLLNGDPLSGRTTHAPLGRPTSPPLGGALPYTWEESATDALKNYPPQPLVWDIGHALIYFEAYNGFGYRRHLCPSPYVWGFTSVCGPGKYVADGSFNPLAVSDQAGCGALLKQLIAWGIV